MWFYSHPLFYIHIPLVVLPFYPLLQLTVSNKKSWVRRLKAVCLPLWNSMPCLRSVRVCIYYAPVESKSYCIPHGFGFSVIIKWNFLLLFLIVLFSQFQRKRMEAENTPSFAISKCMSIGQCLTQILGLPQLIQSIQSEA